MADPNVTPARAGLTPQQFDDALWVEYVRESQFKPFMGSGDRGMTSLIHINEDLTRKVGDNITFATVRKLVGAGVTGNTVLEGNEEILDLRSMKLPIGVVRHAVAATDWDEQKSIHSLRGAAKPALKVWSMERMRAEIILSLTSMNGVPFASATAGQRNEWLVDNADRVQFGALVANGVSGVMATALATVDGTADKMTGKLLETAKRRAKNTHPAIRPVQVDKNGEWFVAFMPSMHFRDFGNDPVVVDAQKHAADRGKDNPLFTDGDLVWKGIIAKEVPEMGPVTTNGGAAGIPVAATALCGAQALGIGWAQRLKTTTNVRDYGFTTGVGIQEMRGIGKLRFGKNAADDTSDLVDQGVFTIFASAEPDA